MSNKKKLINEPESKPTDISAVNNEQQNENKDIQATQSEQHPLGESNKSKKEKIVDVTLTLQPTAIRWERRDVVLTRKSPTAIVKSNDIILYEIINAGIRGNVDNDILINNKPVSFYLNKLLNKNIPDEFHVQLNTNTLYYRVGNTVLSRINGGKIDHVFKRDDPDIAIILKGLLLKEIVIVHNKDSIKNETEDPADIKDVINIESAKTEICGMINDLFISRELSSSMIDRVFDNFASILDLKLFFPTALLAEYERAKEIAKDNDEISIIDKVYNETLKTFNARIAKQEK